jgi:hypothetical protein
MTFSIEIVFAGRYNSKSVLSVTKNKFIKKMLRLPNLLCIIDNVGL